MSRNPREDMDRDIFSGMFTAVQDFVKDSFQGNVDTSLKKMAFGEQKIQIEHGREVFLIAIVDGNEPIFLPLYMMEVLKEVEGKYSLILEDWNGDLRDVRGVDEIITKLFQVTDEKGADVEGFELSFASVKDMDEHLIAMIGDNLGDYIRVADKVIKGIVTMRTELGIRANTPLKNVAIKSQDEDVKDAVTKLKIPLQNEINAKNLEAVAAGEEWEGMKLELSLNRELISPAFEQKANRIETLLTYQSPWKIKKTIETEGKYTVGLEGNYLDLTPEMLNINMTLPESVSSKEFDFGTIYIDKEMTEELRAEGISNDIIEIINRMRKELECKDEDYIETMIVVDDRTAELLMGWKDHLIVKTHSYTLEFPFENIFEYEDSGYKVTELKVDGVNILIGIALIEWTEEKPEESHEIAVEALDNEGSEVANPEDEKPGISGLEENIADDTVKTVEGLEQNVGEDEKTTVKLKLKRKKKRRRKLKIRT